jgi:hypothetical protein
MYQGIEQGRRGTILGMPRPKPRSKSPSKRHGHVAHAERRVITDLKSWNIDPEQIDEVRAAFDAGNRGRAMGLARDLGWKPNMPPRKTTAQLDREIAESLAKRPQYDNADTFWNAFEDQVTKEVATWGASRTGRYNIGDGKQRVLEPNEPPEVFARRVRDASREIADTKGLRALHWNSTAFQKLGRQLGLKVHTLAGLSALYEGIRKR